MSTETLDSLCSVNPEALGAATPMDMEFRYLDISAVTRGRIDWTATQLWKYANAPSRARRRLRPGDVLLCTVRPGLQAHARIPREADAPLVCSTGFAVLRPNLAGDSGFVFHQIFSDSVAAQLRAVETGSSYPAVNEGEVRRVNVYSPEKEERWRIAWVLDTVDEAIAKTEAVIAKLRQVRAGLLHDLLIRGLDLNGQLRDPIAHPEKFQDSPLGRIPREWDVVPLARSIATTFDYRGRTPLKINMQWGGGEIPALSAMNVEMGRINFEKETNFGSQALYDRWMTQGRTEQGDVLITMEAPLGNIAQIPDGNRYILSQRVVVLRPKQGMLTKDFLAIQMSDNRFQKELVKRSSGSTAVGIQRAKLELIEIAVPQRIDEQDRIALNIHRADSQIVSVERELQKLRHLKSGLMTDLLTGRARVPISITNK